jgi:hypothetical protein
MGFLKERFGEASRDSIQANMVQLGFPSVSSGQRTLYALPIDPGNAAVSRSNRAESAEAQA